MFSELLSDITFWQSCRRSYFQCQTELARFTIKIKILIFCHSATLRKIYQEGKLACLWVACGKKEFSRRKPFFVHASFESKQKIKGDLRRLITFSFVAKNFLLLLAVQNKPRCYHENFKILKEFRNWRKPKFDRTPQGVEHLIIYVSLN